MGLRRIISARLENKVLADKDEVNKDKAKSHIIANFITLVLQINTSFFKVKILYIFKAFF